MVNRDKIKATEEAINKVYELYSKCVLCGHYCKVNRADGKMGQCGVSENNGHVKVSHHLLHFGEEPMLVGEEGRTPHFGSGTVFFSRCNLGCVYCQNYQISSEGLGDTVSIDKLASYFLSLQNKNANNINLVSPTHVIYDILLALKIAFENGLNIPIVYNTNGYDSLGLINALDNVVDIYLPDIKYYDSKCSLKYSKASNYYEVAIKSINAMKTQVGENVYSDSGILKKGMIIRHLVLPNNASQSYDILLELKNCNFLETPISLMSQYSPKYKALQYSEISDTLTEKEYNDVLNFALSLGFNNILAQELESKDNYLPDFDDDNPFK